MVPDIHVIIADDQQLLRDSLEQIINSDPHITVTDSVGSGEELIEACNRKAPDLILMDVEMPRIDGLAALNILKKSHPDIKVLMLTTFENPEYITDAFLGGADGYITKDIGYEKLILTIRCVAMGMTVIHPGARKILLERFKPLGPGKATYTDLLSMEEINIVRLIVMGESNKTIAETLHYAEGTVKNKVSRLYEKLGITNRLELAVYAVENGIE
ncbi:response regulator transcription factor [Desulfoluna butyratoxydans]|uniref:Transcription regulator luxr c-terminal n=1 Tax=Desulfoluna butyratoxydans TaxID=231438 RepID=A0A4V6ILI9_9BACT|nr:response regulator transcription factor [Desulfoluna butyratoxydans]VFQ45318.1 transcription regulator luxr c-terminal [Desulfoluna butyratoxydans]